MEPVSSPPGPIGRFRARIEPARADRATKQALLADLEGDFVGVFAAIGEIWGDVAEGV